MKDRLLKTAGELRQPDPDKELPPDAFEQIHPFHNWLIINIPVFTTLTDPAVSVSEMNAPYSAHSMDTPS